MIDFLKSLLISTRDSSDKEAKQPSGFVNVTDLPERLYLIGDIHGRLDLLEILQAQIDEHAAACSNAEIVVLGDLIDRGPSSAGVIDHLLKQPSAGPRWRVIAGNHELMFLRFLKAPKKNLMWLGFGGLETLASYGVQNDALSALRSSSTRGRVILESYIPEDHRAFLESLPLVIQYPHCIAVHAGLRPGIPIRRQNASDITTIRDGFLETNADFGKPVIHGHTPVREAEDHGTRINVDTGAYATGSLTAVCLTADNSPAFLTTAATNSTDMT